MPQVKLPANVQVTDSGKTNWNNEKIFDILLDGEVVGTAYRSSHELHRMAKHGNIRVGTTVRKGWEWSITRSVAQEIGHFTKFNRRSTSYTLFSSRAKAVLDLVEYVVSRRIK